MTSVNVQASEFAARYVDPEGVPIANAGQALLGAGSASASSSNAPKFGTLIPNRIFVGGIPSNTTEQELKTYFSSFGQVKDVKIINDRLGVSKGSYGFVTFESQEVAEKIIKNESETLIFKDRKLNIGHAIRKQQLFPRPADVPPALFFPGGAAIPCSFQSGMPIFPLTGQDYSVLAQPGSTYQQMLLQQANGAMYLSPQPNQQAAAAAATAAAVQYSALQSHLAAHQNAAAATFATLQHHQQYQQASLTAPLAAGGQTSQAAMMAAAAAAVAAASQWSNAANTAANGHNSSGTTSAGLPPPPQLTPAPSVSVGQHAPATLGGAVSGNCNGVLDVTQSPQVAALAAAVAAQQQLAAAAAAAAAWRWSSPSAAAAAAAASQHSSGGSGALLAPSPSALTNGSATTPTGQSVSQTASQQPSIFHCDGLMSPPQQLQPTLLPTAVFAPAIFEGGIAATSSPLLTNHRHLVSPSANNNHNNTNTTITVTPTATSTNGNGSCTSNCAGQISSQQAPQTPHLYGTPTPQPIILDVYSGAGGGIPLAPLKQTSLLSAEGLMVVEHTGGASGLKQNGGGGGCGAGGRGGAGSSPKKLTAANGTTTSTRAAI